MRKILGFIYEYTDTHGWAFILTLAVIFFLLNTGVIYFWRWLVK